MAGLEILLAPSIFLRIDHETTVEMANPGLADTLLAVPKGIAMEVAEIRPENNVRINADSASTRLLKRVFTILMRTAARFACSMVAVVDAGESRLELKCGHELSPGGPGQLKA